MTKLLILLRGVEISLHQKLGVYCLINVNEFKLDATLDKDLNLIEADSNLCPLKL